MNDASLNSRNLVERFLDRFLNSLKRINCEFNLLFVGVVFIIIVIIVIIIFISIVCIDFLGLDCGFRKHHVADFDEMIFKSWSLIDAVALDHGGPKRDRIISKTLELFESFRMVLLLLSITAV